MSNRKAEIMDLIGKRPQIRLVEISDALDIEMDVVEAAIAYEVGSGAIITTPILAPNGRQQPSYRLRDTVAKVELACARTFGPASSAPSPKNTTALPAVRVKEGDGRTKATRAIDYLRETGPVPVEFLSRAMGLGDKGNVRGYLAIAIRDKRIEFGADKLWRLGPAEAPAPAAQKPDATAEKQGPAAPQPATTVPEVEPATPAPVAAAQIEIPAFIAKRPVPAAEHFVMGLFSTGEVTINQDGQELKLKPGNAAALLKYLKKLEPMILDAV